MAKTRATKSKKTSSRWVCNACGATHSGWYGRCPSCGEWNTIEEEAAPPEGGDRVVLAAGGPAALTERRPPLRTGRPVPPLPPVGEFHRSGGTAEHQRTGLQIGRRHPGVQRRVQGPLGHGEVAGRRDEVGELGRGHGVAFDRERPDGDRMDRGFLGIEARRTHPE